MSAKNHDWTNSHNRAGTAARLLGQVGDSWPRSAGTGGWVSESIGLDSRMPGLPVKNGSGADHFMYEKVSVGPAQTPRSGGGVPVAPGISSRSRPRSPPEPLQDATVQWLDQLPKRVRPVELTRQFPRIANKLCGLWNKPALCSQYLNNLLMDTRDGTREGFPMVVAAEIATLLGSVDSPATNQPWGQAKGTR